MLGQLLRPCLRFLLCLLAGSAPFNPALAEESWPHLPSDEEIQGARERLLGELNFDSPSCAEVASQCVADPDEVARQVCIARACLGACILGSEVRKSRLGEIELIKAHHPAVPSPRSAHVFALLKVERTRDDCAGHLTDEIEYSTKMLEYNMILAKVPEGAPSAMRRDWVFLSQGIDYGVIQQDSSSRAERDLVIASYFEPGRLVRGFPGEDAVPADGYRLSISAGDPRHPLRLLARLEQRIPSRDTDAEPQYRAAADTRIDVAALRYGGNEQRLAGYFETTRCANCETSEVHGHRAQSLSDNQQAIRLSTDGDGRVSIEFFLDFAALSQARALAPGARIRVPLQFTAQVASGNNSLRAVAQQQYSAELDAIGVVEAISYEPPQLFDPLSGSPLPRGGEAPLFAYLDDEGTRDGPRSLVRAERVIVKRSGEATIGESGITPGHTLDSEHYLQVGDRITVNACGLVSNRVENGLPFGDAGRIWVSLRYFDGLIGKFGVSGKVCRAGMTVGTSGEASGFTSTGTRFVYWAGESGVEAAVVWLYPPLAVASYARKIIKGLSWGGDHDAVYVVLQSAVAVEFDEDGALQVSTREGEPRVITAQTDEEGLLVPTGMSARIDADGAALLQQTAADRAERADAWLTSVEALAPTAVDAADAPTADFPSMDYSSHSADAIDWATVAAVAVPLMLLVVWIGRRRFGNSASRAIPGGALPKSTSAPGTTHASKSGYCSQCGSPLGANAKFCGSCGAPRTR